MIEHFLWTFHGEKRLAERGLSQREVELAVRLGAGRPNRGAADWRVADTVVSEEIGWGLLDHDPLTDDVVGIEIWAASSRLPAELLARLPSPVSGS